MWRLQITSYDAISAWEPLSDSRVRADPRCRIVLHMNWKAQTLPVILSGLPCEAGMVGNEMETTNWTALPQPPVVEIVRCSALAQVKRGNYKTPTFLVHGTADELIPWQQSRRIWRELVDRGISAGLALVEGAPHICDTSNDPGSPDWKAVLQGYGFLAREVGRCREPLGLCRVETAGV